VRVTSLAPRGETPHPLATVRLSYASGGASGSRMDREAQDRMLPVPGWGRGPSSRHQPGQA